MRRTDSKAAGGPQETVGTKKFNRRLRGGGGLRQFAGGAAAARLGSLDNEVISPFSSRLSVPAAASFSQEEADTLSGPCKSFQSKDSFFDLLPRSSRNSASILSTSKIATSKTSYAALLLPF